MGITQSTQRNNQQLNDGNKQQQLIGEKNCINQEVLYDKNCRNQKLQEQKKENFEEDLPKQQSKEKEIFERYCKGNIITSEGIYKLIQELGVKELTDSRALWIAWKFQVKDFEITEKNFIETLKNECCTDLNDFKKLIPSNPLSNHSIFKKLYLYAFLSNTDVSHKWIDKDDAIDLLLQFYGDNNSKVNQFINFINAEAIKSLNKDEWNVFFDFIQVINNDYSNYEDDSCWPLLFDRFVDYCKSCKC
ncbi:Defective in cullin neddylation protein [Entamoeba marina]